MTLNQLVDQALRHLDQEAPSLPAVPNMAVGVQGAALIPNPTMAAVIMKQKKEIAMTTKKTKFNLILLSL